jgi:hypothetical protein
VSPAADKPICVEPDLAAITGEPEVRRGAAGTAPKAAPLSAALLAVAGTAGDGDGVERRSAGFARGGSGDP